MDWEKHRKELLEETEKTILEAIDELEDGDKICSVFYYISQQDTVTIVIDSLHSKDNHEYWTRKRKLENFDYEQVTKHFNLHNYYDEFSSLGLDLAFEGGYVYQTDKIWDTSSGEYKEYKSNEVKSCLQAQANLVNSEVLKNGKIADCIDLSFSLGQGLVLSNGSILKEKVTREWSGI